MFEARSSGLGQGQNPDWLGEEGGGGKVFLYSLIKIHFIFIFSFC